MEVLLSYFSKKKICSNAEQAVEFINSLWNTDGPGYPFVEVWKSSPLEEHDAEVARRKKEREETRTLMKKAVEQYMNRVIKFDITDITDDQLRQFCDVIIRNGFQNLGEAGVNQSDRNTILSSIAMMTKLKSKI